MSLMFCRGTPQYPNYDKYAPEWLKEKANKFGEQEKGDVNSHLPTLYELCLAATAQNVVELGLWSGNSVFALIAGVMPFNGKVISVDIKEFPEANQKIDNLGLSDYWEFRLQDSVECGLAWTDRVDGLFIDTTHTYQQTLSELNAWCPHVYKGGFIALHDIVHDGRSGDGGVSKAIHNFLKSHPMEYIYTAHYWNNGLGILSKLP